MPRPKATLVASLLLLAAVAGLFTVLILRGQSAERRSAERRFEDRAGTSAALTASLFANSARINRGQLAERLASADIDRAQLDEALKGNGATYSAIFDARGKLLATGSGTSSANAERLAAVPPSVGRVLRRQELFNWSDPMVTAKGWVIEGVSSVDTDQGLRVLVRGYPMKGFAPFIGGYLAGLPGGKAASAYVVDGTGGVIATSTRTQRAPGRMRDGALELALLARKPFAGYGTGRHYAVAPVVSTPWRVVIAEPDAVLYKGVGGVQQWVLLGLMLLAGLAAAGLMANVVHAKTRLRHAFTALERQSAELERSNAELKRSNAELEQFASVASHDLQEPLRKVQTFGDQLERRFGDEIPAEGKDYLRRMRNASARMSTLIDDLLRFSRVTTHARPPREVDLSRIAREVCMDLDHRVQVTHGSVEVGALPVLQADATQMRQLLQNLIGNALKFHRPGIAPEVTLEPVEAPDADHVAFAVTDNGIGFEPVYAERIFRVFERLHPRDVFEGTGIGLALCRKIVERHGGTIAAAGEPEAGSRFLVILPRTQPEAEPAPADAPATPSKEPVGV